jgi:SAM-dependent methyltransferase
LFVAGTAALLRAHAIRAFAYSAGMSTWNDPGLIKLGAALKERGYDFVQPGVAEVKRYRRASSHPASLIDNLFGWGVNVPGSAVDAELLALMQAARVVRHVSGDFLCSSVGAARVGADLLFHTAGPNAAVDAVFLGPDTYRFIDGLAARLDGVDAPLTIFEVGSGSGAASIWLARRFPGARVTGCDINPAAVSLARVNARLAGLHNVDFQLGDVLSGVDGTADLVVSNPPFIADAQGRTYRDGGAMLGMELPLRILREAAPRLRPGGAMHMYTASPIVASEHHIAPPLAALFPHGELRELEASIFDDLLDLPAYRDVERVAAVMISVTQPAPPGSPPHP